MPSPPALSAPGYYRRRLHRPDPKICAPARLWPDATSWPIVQIFEPTGGHLRSVSADGGGPGLIPGDSHRSAQLPAIVRIDDRRRRNRLFVLRPNFAALPIDAMTPPQKVGAVVALVPQVMYVDIKAFEPPTYFYSIRTQPMGEAFFLAGPLIESHGHAASIRPCPRGAQSYLFGSHPKANPEVSLIRASPSPIRRKICDVRWMLKPRVHFLRTF